MHVQFQARFVVERCAGKGASEDPLVCRELVDVIPGYIAQEELLVQS